MSRMQRRQFLGALGAGVLAPPLMLSARQAEGPRRTPPPIRKAKSTKLFKSPDGFPNALEAVPEGLWIGDQVNDRATLVDLSGKVLRSVETESHNTSGIAVGGGYLWLGGNGNPSRERPVKTPRGGEEIIQADMNGRTIKAYKVPFGGGGMHGIEWVNGKLWVVSLRLSAIMQIDPATFQTQHMLPLSGTRPHGLAWDNGVMWVVFGDDRQIRKLDGETGRVLEIVQLTEADPDPHGLCMHKGQLYVCDAGHLGGKSPLSGWVCRVEVV